MLTLSVSRAVAYLVLTVAAVFAWYLVAPLLTIIPR